MNSTQRGFISIIRSAVTGQPNILPEDFDLAAAAAIAKKHQIIPILFYGAQQCGISEKDPLMRKLFISTCQYLSVSERQMQEVERIFAAFEEESVDYMPLKGTLMKSLYPRQEMRPMSDADILIRYEQYEEIIKPLMEKLGFSEGRTSDNELVWERPCAYIELHRRLLPSYNKDYYAYYGDGWRLAKLQQGTRYAMSDEDQMVFLFTHFAKHYRDAGIGIRHLVDIQVYLDKHPALDQGYIREQLRQLQLCEFYDNILKTLRVWFADEESDAVSDFITQMVFNSGVYGTEQAHALSDALKLSKKAGKSRKLRQRKLLAEIFPDYNYMCIRYPKLKGKKILLPVYWVLRLLDAVFHRGDKIRARRKKLDYISDENVSDYQQALNFVGLDFNFKE
jgi:hypothetical protein